MSRVRPEPSCTATSLSALGQTLTVPVAVRRACHTAGALVACLALVGAIAGVGLRSLLPARVQLETVVGVVLPQVEVGSATTALATTTASLRVRDQVATTGRALLLSPQVQAQAIDRVHQRGLDGSLYSVTVTAGPTGALRMRVTADSPEFAEAIGSALVGAVSDQLSAEFGQAELTALQAARADTAHRTPGVGLAAAIGSVVGGLMGALASLCWSSRLRDGRGWTDSPSLLWARGHDGAGEYQRAGRTTETGSALSWNVGAVLADLSLGERAFLVGVLAKQFYLGASGSLQIGDAFLLVGTFLILADFRRPAVLDRRDSVLGAFVCLVCLVNALWAWRYGDEGFSQVTSFYVFNLLIVVGFRAFARHERALQGLYLVLVADVMTQVGVYALGLGRYWDSVRYEGTFNDPNQLSFFLFSATCMLTALTQALELRRWPLVLMTGAQIPVLLAASSTGITLGFVVLVVGVAVAEIARSHSTAALLRAAVLAVLLPALVVAAPSLTSRLSDAGTEDHAVLTQRVLDKFDKLAGTAQQDAPFAETPIVKDRQLDRVLLHPEHLLLGAGEGARGRWPDVPAAEVHSTWIAVWFYYGVLGIFLVGWWIWMNVKHARGLTAAVLLAMLLESMTLANQRQPFLWMLVVLVAHAGQSVGARRSAGRVSASPGMHEGGVATR